MAGAGGVEQQGYGANLETGLDKGLQQQLLSAKLPTLPAIAVQLIALGRSTSASIAQLVEIVSNDPSISAALVRMANSAAYQRIRPADSVTLATSYLGFEKSRMVALSASLIPALSGSGEPAFCFAQFWRRALIAGAIARAIGLRLFARDTESLFLAALLQDIGMLALARLQMPIYDRVHCNDFSHAAAVINERRVLGEDHAAVGAWLLEHWRFPARLVRAVRVSNNPALWRATNDGTDFSGAVLAAGLTADVWMWSGSPPDLSMLQSQICKLLGLDWKDVLTILTEASSEIPLVEALCGIQIGDLTSMQMALTILRTAPQTEPQSL